MLCYSDIKCCHFATAQHTFDCLKGMLSCCHFATTCRCWHASKLFALDKTTDMSADAEACVCGYRRGDRGNWSRHRKECKVLKAVEPLQQEIDRLRTQQQAVIDEQRDAAMRALEERMEAKYSLLADKVDELEAQQQALVPAKQTINNNNIHIHIHAYENTPFPNKKEVLALMKSPRSALPNYLVAKHLSNPKCRNIKLVGDDRVAIYSRDRESGVSKWKTRERKPTLTRIVGRLIDDLTKQYESPRDEGWKSWKAHCSDTGLNWSDREGMDAFKEAERQIEDRLKDEA